MAQSTGTGMVSAREYLKNGSSITLKNPGCDTPRTFVIEQPLGYGSSSMVYRAKYAEGGDEYFCILKELYPKNCGLHRDGVHLTFIEGECMAEDVRIYRSKKALAEKSYRVQLGFYNNSASKWLNPTVSVPLGIYEDDCAAQAGGEAIFYTAFTYKAGCDYSDIDSGGESLRDILNVMIQLTHVVDGYHKSGFLCFDIKEKNVFIAGSKEYPSVMLFDFNSFVEMERLKSFKVGSRFDSLELSTTTDSSEVLLPKEMQSVINKAGEELLKSPDGCIHSSMFARQIQRLGENGDLTDMFMIGSLLYKRIFGRAAEFGTVKSSPELWELPETSKAMGEACRSKLKQVLTLAMNPEYSQRYASMEDFAADMEELKVLSHFEIRDESELAADSGFDVRYLGTSLGSLGMASDLHWKRLGSSGKFSKLSKLSGRFDSRIRLCGEKMTVLSPGEVFLKHRCVFLKGDGGMGKSTAIYDWWGEQLGGIGANRRVCFYIDLSLYKALPSGELNCDDSTAHRSGWILRYITSKIFMNDECLSLAGLDKEGDNSRFSPNSLMQSILKNYFLRHTDEPQFTLFLDGFNEIIDENSKSSFISELEHIAAEWVNVGLVLTGRDLPKDTAIADIAGYDFVGVQDDEIEAALMDVGNYTGEQIEKIRSDERLWEVLRVPMFLGLFTSIDPERAVALHTRGEILHEYVNSCESETAGRISKAGVHHDARYKNYRDFVVTHCLPFAAHQMDRQRKFYADTADLKKAIRSGFEFYIDNELIYDSYTEPIMCFDAGMEYDKSMMMKLILDQTGYCVRNSDGTVGFSHQYFRDYFAARFVFNLLNSLSRANIENDARLQILLEQGMGDYSQSREVCRLLGEITGDYVISSEDGSQHKSILDFYLELLRGKGFSECGRSLVNIINTWKSAGSGTICAKSFDGIDFGNVPLNGIRFNHEGALPCSFRGSRLSELNLMSGHSGGISCAVFSDRSEYLLTGSLDCTAILWECGTSLMYRKFAGHTDFVTCADISPDASLCATGSRDKTVRLWCVESGEATHVLQGHNAAITSVKLLADKGLCLTASKDGTAKLWSIEKGICTHDLTGHTAPVNTAVFSPDGELCLTASDDGTAKIWSVESGTCIHTLGGQTDSEQADAVLSAVFSPDGRHCVTCHSDGSAKIWSTESGESTLVFKGHAQAVCSADFSKNGDLLITGSKDLTARVWSVSTGKCKFVLDGHTDVINSVEFSQDDRLCITASCDRTARIWSVESGECIHTLTGHTDSISAASFTRNGDHCITASLDNSVKIWTTETGQCIGLLEGYTGSLNSVKFSPDMAHCLTASDDHTAGLWSMDTGKCIHVLDGHTDAITQAAFSPNVSRILTASSDCTARLWEADSGDCLHILSEHSETVTSVVFSPDSMRCLTGSCDGTAKLWNVETGECLLTLRGHTDEITSVAFSPDGDLCLTGSSDHTAKLWSPENGECIMTLKGRSSPITSVAFSPNGEYCLTGLWDTTAQLWSTATGHCIHTLDGHNDRIRSVQFSPDGNLCLTGSYDNAAKLWSIDTGECLFTYEGYINNIISADFSTEGKYCILGQTNGIARIFDIALGKMDESFCHIKGVHIEGCDFTDVDATDSVKKILYQYGADCPEDWRTLTLRRAELICFQFPGA